MASSNKAEVVDVSYAAGFLVGRLVSTDDSEGFEVDVPGVDVRLRVSEIVAYCYGSANCLEVQVAGNPENYEVWGTIEAMDRVMSRDRMGGVVEASPAPTKPADPSLRLTLVPDAPA